MSPTAGTVWASSTKTVGRTDRRPTAIARCAILCANVPTTTTKASKPNLPNSLTGLIRRTFLIGRAHRRTKSLALTDHDPIPQTLPPVSELRLSDLRQRLHQEVRGSHPHLDRAEGMLG